MACPQCGCKVSRQINDDEGNLIEVCDECGSR